MRLIASLGSLAVIFIFCIVLFNKSAAAVETPLDNAYLSTATALVSRLSAGYYSMGFRYPGFIEFPCHDAKSKNPTVVFDDECLAICVHTHAAPRFGEDYVSVHDALMAVNFKECEFSEARRGLSEMAYKKLRALESSTSHGMLWNEYVSKLRLLYTWKKGKYPSSFESCANVSGTKNSVSTETCNAICNAFSPYSALEYLSPLFPKCSGFPTNASKASSISCGSAGTLTFPNSKLPGLDFNNTQSFFWQVSKDYVLHLLTHHMLKLIKDTAEVSLNSAEHQLTIKTNSWCSSSQSFNTSLVSSSNCVLLCNMLVPFFANYQIVSLQNKMPLCKFGEREYVATRLTHQNNLVPQYVWEAHVFEAYFQIQKEIDGQLEYDLDSVKRLAAATRNGNSIRGVCASRSTDHEKLSDAHCTALCYTLHLFNFLEKKKFSTLSDNAIIPCIFTPSLPVKQ